MEKNAINLLILDDNTLMAGPLSIYLNDRFGARLNISTFFDADKCNRNIDEYSHVIVLDYFLDEKDRINQKGMKNFNLIKQQNPQAEVTLITSDKDVTEAVKEIQKEISRYIMNVSVFA